MKLRHDTTFDRAALSQEWRQVLAPEPGEDGTTRRVVLSIPYGLSEIYVSLQKDANEYYGANRSYKAPIARPGAEIEFHLRPNQEMWACTRQGTASIAVLVEYLAE